MAEDFLGHHGPSAQTLNPSESLNCSAEALELISNLKKHVEQAQLCSDGCLLVLVLLGLLVLVLLGLLVLVLLSHNHPCNSSATASCQGQ